MCRRRRRLLGGRECVGVLWGIVWATLSRFLPTQEWSARGLWFVGDFWRGMQATIWRVGDEFPFPLGPFLRRQESIPATAGIS